MSERQSVEKDATIEALIAALLPRVGQAVIPVGTRVYVRSLRAHGTVVGPDGVDREALAVRLDSPFPRGFEGGFCCASADECTTVTPSVKTRADDA